MIKNRKLLANICLCAGILLFIVASSTLSQQSVQTVLGDSPPIYQHDNLAGREHRPLYVPGQLIVKFKKDVPMNMRGQVLAANQMALVKALLLPDCALVEFDQAKDVRLMAASLLDDPSIKSAEPNYYRYADFTPNDEYYSYQWHFPMIQMPAAWDKSNGAGVTVAVIDSGVAYEDYGPYAQAPDLAGTIFVAGWDFVNGDSHPNDDNSHGTHVAGTIAQTTNNGMGVAGIAYGANIMPIKVLDSEGRGTDQWVADAIVWAVNHGAQVINLSLGGPAPSSVLENAVNYAFDNGVTVVAASGNGGEDGIGDPVVDYPAAYDNCIAVGAVRYDESRSYYSNYGPALDLAAPGGDVRVDQNGDGYDDGVLQQTFNPITKDYTDFGYWFFQGTSMAAPHVSGVAALLIAHGNANTPDEVRAALENTAKDKGPAGWDEEYGYGLIQANDALDYGVTPTLSEAVDNASLTWTTDGDADWFGQTSVYYYDGDAAQSGDVTYEQNSWIQTTATGPGILSFYWKVDWYTDLVFYIDGVEKSKCWSHEWELKTYSIPSGNHTLRWVYAPSLSGYAGFLDKVVFTAGPVILVESPNGGETLSHRNFYCIRWLSTEDVGPNVKIELYKGGSLSYTVSASTDNDGYYKWFVPTTQMPGTDYQIKVTSISSSSISDYSDGYFSIAECFTPPVCQSSFVGSLVLDGDDDYAEAEDHPELDVGDEPGESFSIEAWVNFQGSADLWPGKWRYIINKPQSYQLFAKRYVDPADGRTIGCFSFRLAPPSGQFWGGYHCRWPPYSLGWHHVAGVFYKGTGEMRIYMDGEALSDPIYFGPAINNSSEDLKVGVGLTGGVDEVRISDVARYDRSTYILPASPFTCDEHTRALWHFDEYDGATQFHDACGVDNLLSGYNGAHSEGAGPAACYDFMDPPGVGVEDIQVVASRWRTFCTNPDPDNDPDTPNYDSLYDIDGDCDIDIVDIMKVAAHWGETCE